MALGHRKKPLSKRDKRNALPHGSQYQRTNGQLALAEYPKARTCVACCGKKTVDTCPTCHGIPRDPVCGTCEGKPGPFTCENCDGTGER